MKETRLHAQPKAAALSSFTTVRGGVLQRKCACGGSSGVSGSCDGCSTKQLSLQRRPIGSTESATEAPIVDDMLRSASLPLHQSTQALMPRRSQHNFGEIKVDSAQSCRPDQMFSTITPTGDETEFRTVDASNSSMFHTQPPPAPAPAPVAGGGGAPASDHCTATGSFTSIPSGMLPATFAGGLFGAPFTMIGEITTAIPCSCTRGEYRQFVRGIAKVNGATVPHPLCANNMSETVMHEDCMSLGGTNYRYGYHSIPFATSKFSNPDQATGCTFTGSDYPGFPVSSVSTGDTLELLLEFQGKLVDTVTGTDLASSTWTVEGTGTVP